MLSDNEHQAFTELKLTITLNTILAAFRQNAPITVKTDASHIGSMMLYLLNASRTLKDPENVTQ